MSKDTRRYFSNEPSQRTREHDAVLAMGKLILDARQVRELYRIAMRPEPRHLALMLDGCSCGFNDTDVASLSVATTMPALL